MQSKIPHFPKIYPAKALARSGLERPIGERFYFSKPYHSWHGSPSQQDSHIPLILARQGDTGERLQAIVEAAVGKTPSQLDFVPLVRALVGTNRAAPRPAESRSSQTALPRAPQSTPLQAPAQE
jgi:hypothetical protein